MTWVRPALCYSIEGLWFSQHLEGLGKTVQVIAFLAALMSALPWGMSRAALN